MEPVEARKRAKEILDSVEIQAENMGNAASRMCNGIEQSEGASPLEKAGARAIYGEVSDAYAKLVDDAMRLSCILNDYDLVKKEPV